MPREFYSEVWDIYFSIMGFEGEGGALHLPGLIRAALMYKDPEKYRICVASTWGNEPPEETALAEMLDLVKKRKS